MSEIQKFVCQFGGGGFCGGGAGAHDKVVRGKPIAVEAERLAQDALKTVAFMGFAGFSGGDKAQAGFAGS